MWHSKITTNECFLVIHQFVFIEILKQVSSPSQSHICNTSRYFYLSQFCSILSFASQLCQNPDYYNPRDKISFFISVMVHSFSHMSWVTRHYSMGESKKKVMYMLRHLHFLISFFLCPTVFCDDHEKPEHWNVAAKRCSIHHWSSITTVMNGITYRGARTCQTDSSWTGV